MLNQYYKEAEERKKNNLPAKPLTSKQVKDLIQLLTQDDVTEELLELLQHRVPPGVDEAAKVKAEFLKKIINKEATSKVIDPKKAVYILGKMEGGYNITPLINALEDPDLAEAAYKELRNTLLVYNEFDAVVKKMQAGNEFAKKTIESWANAEWFENKEELPEKITLTVFKVPGETNTDDLSPAQDAWSRPDIPLHSLSMLKMTRDGIQPDKDGEIGPMKLIEQLKQKGFPLVYVGDIVGTGSSRKSAANSLIWLMGKPIPYIPNKNSGGFCFGGKIAPIFFNTLEDSGALPIELNPENLHTGDIIDLYPYAGKICKHKTEEVITTFNIESEVLFDEVRAGGRIPLIIGRSLTAKAKQAINCVKPTKFKQAKAVKQSNKGFTLAQKMVGKACGKKGVRPGEYCEPYMSAVGSQDTTGPMTRNELKDLACLGFNADLTMQSFCHTAAYPKPIDVDTHQTLPSFMAERGGISLKPKDGVIHSWLNRMLLPDCVGTGGDSHTRFPLGISFPAGSGLVAFAAATGVIPLNMPESVLVKFSGTMQPGITLRDMVHAIPYYAIKEGLLTIDKRNKKNIFSGRVLEIEGLEFLKIEQAFELADASAERSSSGCTIKLNKEPIIEYITSNITMLKWMINEGYQNKETIQRRINKMQEWLDNPVLLEADKDADYAAIININMDEIKEPILCAPNDPDDARKLSEVAGDKVDEVFIGSCMTNIGHFRATGNLLKDRTEQLNTKLWIVPPTKMDQDQLTQEGYYHIFGKLGARIEVPGCSLCMGNQARVKSGCTVVSTSTRNFPNRMGAGANVYLSSAEVATVTAMHGEIPNMETYMKYNKELIKIKDETYRYLNFNEIEYYQNIANKISVKQHET